MTAVDEHADPVDVALRTLLDHYPAAEVAAVTGDATARTVPVPAEVPLEASHIRFGGKSIVHLVSEPDQAVVTRVWSRARVVGHASASIRILYEPPVNGTLHIFDTRHLYGVLIAVFVDGGHVELPELSRLDDGMPPTRVARVVKDARSTILDADRGVEALLGWTLDDLKDRRSLELIHADDQEKAIDSWVRMLDYPGSSQAVRLRHRHRDGRWVWVELRNHNLLADPAYGHVVAEMVDISEEVAAQEAVLARQQLLEQLTETLPIGLFHADLDGNLLYVNGRLTEITGLPLGSRLGEWPGLAGARYMEVISSALVSAATGQASESAVEVIDPAGRLRYCSLNVRPLADRYGVVGGVTGTVQDVTQSVTERRDLEVRAATDALTGCLNRSATLALLQDALDGIDPNGHPDGVAVIFVDVDGLKELNDRLGHAAGDQLLTEVARRLTNAVRARDAVGRYGGDEFVVLALHVRSAEHAMTLARWIAARTLRSVSIEGEQIEIRVSLGVAWTPGSQVKAETLLRHADTAMYRSKHEGRCEPFLAALPD